MIAYNAAVARERLALRSPLMPSPFPGMDPYLEGSLWTSFHTQLAVEIQRHLMPLLRPNYLALTNERFIITTLDPEPTLTDQTADIYPDISVGKSSASEL